MKKEKMSLEKMKGILSATLSRDELKAVMAGSDCPNGNCGGSGGQCSSSCWTWSGGPTQTQWWCHKPQGTCVCPVDPWVPCQ